MTVRRLCAALVALGALSIFAACSSSKPSASHSPTASASVPTQSTPPATASSTSATPSTSASATDPGVVQQQIEQSAQAAWLAYWKVSLSLGSKPRTQWTTLAATVAVNPIYAQLLNSVRVQLDQQGLVGYGFIVSRPSWTTPPKPGVSTATMNDCFDGSHAGSKVVTTGKKRTVGEPRTNVRVTFTRGTDEKWRVKQIQYLAASC